MTRYRLPQGPHHLAVDIPDTVRSEVIAPPRTATGPDPDCCIRHALAHPIGTAGLDQLVRPSHRVALIVDDVTRETPAAILLPPVLKILADGGVSPDRVAIVIALGTHRPMTPAEIDRKLGAAVAQRYRIVNESARQQETMVYLGRSSRGIPAWVNRTVAEADIRVGIGMIMPHLDVGHGGGAKIVLPGVCGQATVDAFHEQMADIETDQLGLEDAVLRLDLERFVQETVRLHFIVNVILDSRGRLCHCVAGDAVAAHRAGVRVAREVYGTAVRRRYPLVVVDAYPHHIDLWQSTKALAAGERVTASGGQLILVADCPEGTGPHPRFADYIGMTPDDLRRRWRDHALDDRCAAAEAMAVGRMKQRIRIGMVTSGLSPQAVQHMGFDHYATVEAAIQRAIEPIPAAGIALIAHGGMVLPLLPEGLTKP